MKIADLYPEDINAMQISFAAVRAGSNGLAGGFRATRGCGGAAGTMAELQFKRQTCGCLLALWYRYSYSAELEQIRTSPAAVHRGVSPTWAPSEQVSHVSWHLPAYFSPLRAPHRFQVEETVLDKLKITFENSTDFFGRIVVYHLGVLGERL